MADLLSRELRVLVVEDDFIVARNLEVTLKRRGFNPAAVCHSLDSAYDILSKEEFDIALLDIRLGPSNGGIDLAAHIKEEKGIPVIFVTGYSEDTVYEIARQVRPAGYIRKPFGDAELAACIEAAIERSSAHGAMGDKLPGIRAVAEHLTEAVIVSEIDGRVSLMNPAAERMTGWQEEQAIGRRFKEVVQIRIDSADGVLLLTKKEDGEQPVSDRTSSIRDANGELLGIITLLESAESDGLVDSPGRTAALEKIGAIAKSDAYKNAIGDRAKKSEDLDEDSIGITSPSHPLIDELGDPLIAFDDDGMISHANPEALGTFAEASPLLGREFLHCFAEADAEKYSSEFWKPTTNGKNHRFEFVDSKRDQRFDVRLYRSQGGVICLFHDVSDEASSHERVRQQRLEGLGYLARGLAHEFNNHLTVVGGNIDLAREKLEDSNPEADQLLAEANAANQKAVSLVQQLMTFAAGGKPVRQATRINGVVRNVLLDRRAENPSIRYQFQGGDADLSLHLDRAQIGRLVENLVINAEQSMPDGGLLAVRIEPFSKEDIDSYAPGFRKKEYEDHVVIEVKDTGSGISDSIKEQIFDPYFTTRDSVNATGIGLTVCESIAAGHDGFLVIESQEGEGTLARCFLPLELPSNTMAEASTKVSTEIFGVTENDEERGISGSRQILILEDDLGLLRLAKKTLEREGHNVVTATHGEAAIEAYQRSLEEGPRFDLFISDLTIENGMGGVETIKHLTEADPNINAIVSSGYSDADAMANPQAYGFRGVLPKPYTLDQLRDYVGKMLAEA
ncbi:MAG: response regulator [Verrucomicrobiota bacterium]